MNDRTTTAIRFPDELHRRLREAADERGLSINYLVVKGMEEVIDHLVAPGSFRLTTPEPKTVALVAMDGTHVADVSVEATVPNDPGLSFGDADPDRAPVDTLRNWVLEAARLTSSEDHAQAACDTAFANQIDRNLAMGLWRKARDVIDRKAEGDQ
jgi:hypothetical protein